MKSLQKSYECKLSYLEFTSISIHFFTSFGSLEVSPEHFPPGFNEFLLFFKFVLLISINNLRLFWDVSKNPGKVGILKNRPPKFFQNFYECSKLGISFCFFFFNRIPIYFSRTRIQRFSWKSRKMNNYHKFSWICGFYIWKKKCKIAAFFLWDFKGILWYFRIRLKFDVILLYCNFTQRTKQKHISSKLVLYQLHTERKCLNSK